MPLFPAGRPSGTFGSVLSALAMLVLACVGLGRGQPAQAKETIRDLRVYLDFDDDSATFASWPVDKFGGKLPADQIARGVRLGLSLWASVLPEMRFRFVPADSANLVFRFGPYSQAPKMGMDGWAQAFLPEEWVKKALPACGRIHESRWPDGTPCREWSQNIITLNFRSWTVSGGDFASNHDDHEYLSWVFDRGNLHFRTRPDGPCVDGRAAGAAWSDACVQFKDSPHNLEIRGADLVAAVEHEFGHTVVGEHTPEPPGPIYIDPARTAILAPSQCVRLGPQGFSIMFPGFEEKWWNHRGAFPADIARLRALGYPVDYPLVKWTLTLRRKDGAVMRTRDWSKALAAMLWTRQGRPLSRAQAAREYFLVDLARTAE
jgi:hypothetical protein